MNIYMIVAVIIRLALLIIGVGGLIYLTGVAIKLTRLDNSRREEQIYKKRNTVESKLKEAIFNDNGGILDGETVKKEDFYRTLKCFSDVYIYNMGSEILVTFGNSREDYFLLKRTSAGLSDCKFKLLDTSNLDISNFDMSNRVSLYDDVI